MRRRRKILKPRTPNAPQAKILRSRDFLNPARSAAKIFSDFTGENYMLNKNHNIFEAQNAKKIKPRFRNAPQAKNFETPFSKCAAGENFWNPDFEMRRRRRFLKPRKHRMRRRRKILKPREKRMRRRRKILKPHTQRIENSRSLRGGV